MYWQVYLLTFKIPRHEWRDQVLIVNVACQSKSRHCIGALLALLFVLHCSFDNNFTPDLSTNRCGHRVWGTANAWYMAFLITASLFVIYKSPVAPIIYIRKSFLSDSACFNNELDGARLDHVSHCSSAWLSVIICISIFINTDTFHFPQCN